MIGDIPQQQVDAIVNAANSRLAGGGGVDGAMDRRGGPAIMREAAERYPTGSAVISGAGNLPARFVIHAVGPVWHGGDHGEPELLASAHRRCLELALEHTCSSVAIPALSTGAYGYPIRDAAQVALSTTIAFLHDRNGPEVVRFVLFGRPAYDEFQAVLGELVRFTSP